jgi:hypothetical protein
LYATVIIRIRPFLVNDERVRDVKTILVLVITAMLIAVPSSANQGRAIRAPGGAADSAR